MSKSEETERLAQALETAGREFGKHGGPQSDERERATFGRDLRIAALRYARAYYAEAKDYGLVQEYVKVEQICHCDLLSIDGSHTMSCAIRQRHIRESREP